MSSIKGPAGEGGGGWGGGRGVREVEVSFSLLKNGGVGWGQGVDFLLKREIYYVVIYLDDNL